MILRLQTILLSIIVLLAMFAIIFKGNSIQHFSFEQNQTPADNSLLKTKSSQTINQYPNNSIIDSNALNSISKGYFTNSSGMDIIEIYGNKLYVRFSANYSIAQTYTSKYSKLDYFSLGKYFNYYNIIIEYDKTDKTSGIPGKNVNKTYTISLLNTKGQVIAANAIYDTSDGTNSIGGLLIGNFETNTSNLDVMVFYNEKYLSYDNYVSITQSNIYQLPNMQLIANKTLNGSFASKLDYYYNYSLNGNIISTIETNVSTDDQRIVIFNDTTLTSKVYISDWFSSNTMNFLTIQNYLNNSYLIIKNIKEDYCEISLMKFEKNFNNFLEEMNTTNNLNSFTSSIKVKDVSNSSLIYVNEVNNSVIWKTFDNQIFLNQTLLKGEEYTFLSDLEFNNDNIIDLSVISYINGSISSFKILDGGNLSHVLLTKYLNYTVTSLFNQYYIIGHFTNQFDQGPNKLDQILFVYRNYYYQIYNNGQNDRTILNFISKSGSTITYCSLTNYTISWFLIPSQNTTAYVRFDNTTLIVNNLTTIALNTIDLPKSTNFHIYYSLEIITSKGELLYDNLMLNFISNSCTASSFSILNTSIHDINPIISPIEGLSYFISIGLVSMLVLVISANKIYKLNKK